MNRGDSADIGRTRSRVQLVAPEHCLGRSALSDAEDGRVAWLSGAQPCLPQYKHARTAFGHATRPGRRLADLSINFDFALQPRVRTSSGRSVPSTR